MVGTAVECSRMPGVHLPRLRGFGVWIRRWLRTSKPTEWMSSAAQLLGVLATITGAVIYLKSGVLDSRKAAVESNIALLRIDERHLEDRVAVLKAHEKELEQSKALLIGEITVARRRADYALAGLSAARREALAYRADLRSGRKNSRQWAYFRLPVKLRTLSGRSKRKWQNTPSNPACRRPGRL